MPGISCRRNPSAPRSARDEAGFALIEVMVSAVLLIVLSLATLSVIDRAQSTSSNNRSRDVAAQLAQSEQDTIRQLPVSELAAGYHPGAVPKEVGKIVYTVTSSADWVTDSGGAVTCSTTGRVAYLQTTTSVTWPGMGTTKPVVADAIVDPGVAALGANKGALTVLLSKADGTGTEGITVTADGISSVTDENGCAVIGNIDVGQQMLTYNEPGYVDKTNRQDVQRPVTIGAGSIAQATGFYDQPGTINMTIVDDATPAQPADWPLTVALDNAERTTPTIFTTDIDSTKSNASINVFPFSSAYKTYVGSCSGNDPSNTLYTNAGAAAGAQVNPGQAKSVTLTMRNVTVDLGNTTDATNAKAIVSPDTNAPSMASCPSGAPASVTYNTPTIDSSGKKLIIPVPYGVWRVCAFKRVSGNNYRLSSPSPGHTWNSSNLNLDRPVVVTTPSTTSPYTARTLVTYTLPSSSNSSLPSSC